METLYHVAKMDDIDSILKKGIVYNPPYENYSYCKKHSKSVYAWFEINDAIWWLYHEENNNKSAFPPMEFVIIEFDDYLDRYEFDYHPQMYDADKSAVYRESYTNVKPNQIKAIYDKRGNLLYNKYTVRSLDYGL